MPSVPSLVYFHELLKRNVDKAYVSVIWWFISRLLLWNHNLTSFSKTGDKFESSTGHRDDSSNRRRRSTHRFHGPPSRLRVASSSPYLYHRRYYLDSWLSSLWNLFPPSSSWGVNYESIGLPWCWWCWLEPFASKGYAELKFIQFDSWASWSANMSNFFGKIF